MTAATDQAWIENSLARLEQLEAQREQLAASGRTDKLAEIDEEIRSLYEVLESVAEDEPAPAPANVAAPVAAAPIAAAPMGASPGMAAPAAPMGGAPMTPMTPMGGGAVGAAQGMAPAPPMGAPGMGDPMMMGGDVGFDDDVKPPRSPLPFILIGLLVVGGGGFGAYKAFIEKKPEPKQEYTGPATVIKAGAVAEDTQEPQVAKGADADRTEGTNFKEGSSSDDASKTKRRTGGGSSRPRNSGRGKKDDGNKVDFAKSDDPLAGVK